MDPSLIPTEEMKRKVNSLVDKRVVEVTEEHGQAVADAVIFLLKMDSIIGLALRQAKHDVGKVAEDGVKRQAGDVLTFVFGLITEVTKIELSYTLVVSITRKLENEIKNLIDDSRKTSTTASA